MFAHLLVAASLSPAAPLPNQPPPTAVLQDRYRQPGREAYAGFLWQQQQLLKHPDVLRAALRRPDVARLSIVKKQPDPVAWLTSSLKVHRHVKTWTISVWLGAGPRGEQAVLVNAVVDAYQQEVLRRMRESNERSGSWAKERLAHVDREIDQAEKRVLALRGAIAPLDKDDLAIHRAKVEALKADRSAAEGTLLAIAHGERELKERGLQMFVLKQAPRFP